MRTLGEMLVFRAGRTGEYGYHLLVPTDQKNTCLEKLLATGATFEMLRRPYWHAGLDVFRVGCRPLHTISALAIKNLSLQVTPYRHSFHTRAEDFTV